MSKWTAMITGAPWRYWQRVVRERSECHRPVSRSDAYRIRGNCQGAERAPVSLDETDGSDGS